MDYRNTHDFDEIMHGKTFVLAAAHPFGYQFECFDPRPGQRIYSAFDLSPALTRFGQNHGPRRHK